MYNNYLAQTKTKWQADKIEIAPPQEETKLTTVFSP